MLALLKVRLTPGSQYDATLTQRDAGRGVYYAGIGLILRRAALMLRHIVNPALVSRGRGLGHN